MGPVLANTLTLTSGSSSLIPFHYMPPGTPLTLEADWAVTWRAGVGAALCADTFLVAAPPACVTPPEAGLWPVKRVKVQGMTVDVPDLLER